MGLGLLRLFYTDFLVLTSQKNFIKERKGLGLVVKKPIESLSRHPGVPRTLGSGLNPALGSSAHGLNSQLPPPRREARSDGASEDAGGVISGWEHSAFFSL